MKNILLSVDHKLTIPMYTQIAEQIKDRILSGQIPVDTKLSQRLIAKELGISKHPVSEAFQILEAEGLVSTTPRSGTRVTNNVWMLINGSGETLWDKYIKSGRQKISPESVLEAFRLMDDAECRKYNADSISSTFEPNRLFINVLNNVVERLRITDDLGYFGISGLPSLREALCEHMSRYGLIVSPDQIIVTSGIGESLNQICGAFLGNGIDFFYETPSFLNTIMLVHSTGANMVGINMDEEGIDLGKLLPKLRRSKSSILYVQPVNHNPTGISLSKERRTALLAACKGFDVPIIENDMFRDFTFGKDHPKPLKAFDNSGQVIYIGSLFSCFSGFKISWIVAPRFILERLGDIKKHSELMSNVLVEIYADELLRSGHYYRYLDEINPLMIRQYHKIEEMINKYLSDIATWRRNSPAYFIWLKFDRDIRKAFDKKNSEEYLFFPGVIFDWEDTCHVRLNTMGVRYEDIEIWISKISDLIRYAI